jgi:hypothetical protein
MINKKHTTNKKLILLSICTVIALNIHAQKLKTYYIKGNGEKSSMLYAKFKRTVHNQDNIWVVRDYYLNDSIRMTGNFIDKKLTQKTDTFTSFHPNGKLSHTVVFKNDRKHGNEKFYYITGNLSRSANYNMGEVTGQWIWYNEDGSIENELDNVNPNILSENYSHAEYIGGRGKLIEYLNKLDYRSLIKGRTAIYDRTFTTFQINEEGSVTDVDIIIHGTKEMDSAIIKHLYNMPKWNAEKKNGKYVTSNHILPIVFSNKSEKVLSDKIIGEAFFNSGVNDYKEENYEKAIFKLLQAISRNHMEAKYYYLLGNCYYILKNKDFACEDWSIANSLDSEILKKEIKDLCNLK